jgi:hypothetical protein
MYIIIFKDYTDIILDICNRLINKKKEIIILNDNLINLYKIKNSFNNIIVYPINTNNKINTILFNLIKIKFKRIETIIFINELKIEMKLFSNNDFIVNDELNLTTSLLNIFKNIHEINLILIIDKNKKNKIVFMNENFIKNSIIINHLYLLYNGNKHFKNFNIISLENIIMNYKNKFILNEKLKNLKEKTLVSECILYLTYRKVENKIIVI